MTAPREPPVGRVEPIALIRGMAAHDVHRVVEIHRAAFQGFFLTFLGPRFLRLFYGEAVALDEIAFVAEASGQVVGLVMGSMQPGGFYGKLLKRRMLAFGAAALPAVLRRPSVGARVARAFLKPTSAAKPAGTATLMSIAVDPAGQRLGAGKSLVGAFLREAGKRGAQAVDLTTDRDDNERTNKFYLDFGFRVVREIVTAEGRVLNEYELDVPHR